MVSSLGARIHGVSGDSIEGGGDDGLSGKSIVGG